MDYAKLNYNVRGFQDATKKLSNFVFKSEQYPPVFPTNLVTEPILLNAPPSFTMKEIAPQTITLLGVQYRRVTDTKMEKVGTYQNSALIKSLQRCLPPNLLIGYNIDCVTILNTAINYQSRVKRPPEQIVKRAIEILTEEFGTPGEVRICGSIEDTKSPSTSLASRYAYAAGAVGTSMPTLYAPPETEITTFSCFGSYTLHLSLSFSEVQIQGSSKDAVFASIEPTCVEFNTEWRIPHENEPVVDYQSVLLGDYKLRYYNNCTDKRSTFNFGPNRFRQKIPAHKITLPVLASA